MHAAAMWGDVIPVSIATRPAPPKGAAEVRISAGRRRETSGEEGGRGWDEEEEEDEEEEGETEWAREDPKATSVCVVESTIRARVAK